MCSNLLLVTLGLCMYHVTAEVPKLRNILSGSHYLTQTDLKAEKRHAKTQPEEQHEVYFTVPQLQALKEQFRNYIDKNGDEKASFQEVYEYLQKYNPDITIKKVKDFMARRDLNGDGSVDFIPDYLMEVSSPDYGSNTAREWFDLEDTNGDGYVSRDELIKIATNVGMSKEEAEQTAIGYYMSADQNGDGKLSWDGTRSLQEVSRRKYGFSTFSRIELTGSHTVMSFVPMTAVYLFCTLDHCTGF